MAINTTRCTTEETVLSSNMIFIHPEDKTIQDASGVFFYPEIQEGVVVHWQLARESHSVTNDQFLRKIMAHGWMRMKTDLGTVYQRLSSIKDHEARQLVMARVYKHIGIRTAVHADEVNAVTHEEQAAQIA